MDTAVGMELAVDMALVVHSAFHMILVVQILPIAQTPAVPQAVHPVQVVVAAAVAAAAAAAAAVHLTVDMVATLPYVSIDRTMINSLMPYFSFRFTVLSNIFAVITHC